MSSEEKQASLEEMFGQIEELIGELGNPDIAIDEAFAKYEAGIGLLKKCNEKIDAVEKKVLALGEDGELNEF